MYQSPQIAQNSQNEISLPWTLFRVGFVMLFTQDFIANIIIGSNDNFIAYAAFIGTALKRELSILVFLWFCVHQYIVLLF